MINDPLRNGWERRCPCRAVPRPRGQIILQVVDEALVRLLTEGVEDAVATCGSHIVTSTGQPEACQGRVDLVSRPSTRSFTQSADGEPQQLALASDQDGKGCVPERPSRCYFSLPSSSGS
ncbi:hypothetical protein GCM10023175_00780 [Pseudonocardia xishanensis]|uniref:Uncharacterized protein n=1 Tax=Pseudonocardia xishanensis TaxID=630995 RepID=A0ABP8RCN4_9PSEU